MTEKLGLFLLNFFFYCKSEKKLNFFLCLILTDKRKPPSSDKCTIHWKRNYDSVVDEAQLCHPQLGSTLIEHCEPSIPLHYKYPQFIMMILEFWGHSVIHIN
jgi:hypothetical protein